MREPAPFGKVMGSFLVASIAASLVGGVIVSFLIAHDVPSGFAAMPFVLMIGLALGFPFAFGHALVLGLPVYLWFERRHALNWWIAAAAGSVIGFLPLLLWIGPTMAWGDIAAPLITGASGAAGGLVFRVALSDLIRNP